MIIVIEINDFITNLFPELKDKLDEIEKVRKVLEEYYTINSIKPKIIINKGLAEIHIDVSQISSQQKEFDKAIKFCENRKFKEAIPILENLIKLNL